MTTSAGGKTRPSLRWRRLGPLPRFNLGNSGLGRHVDPSLPALPRALHDCYRIERELGRGGMATVYLAADLRHERQVALKVLRPEIAAGLGTERFLREIRLAAQLHHPHILPLYDSGTLEHAPDSPTAPCPFYVMPYVEGESLRGRLVRERKLAVDEALRIAREVAGALDYAHRHNIVHRDIKPENILLEDGHALVTDFGIGRAIGVARDDNVTATGLIVGTPAYMSPEQVDGSLDLDGRSDIYSLGCVLFEMLVGEPPFKGTTLVAIIANRLRAPAPSARASCELVPEAVAEGIQRALAPMPCDRFPTAAAFVEALTLIGGGAPGAGHVVMSGVSRVEPHAIAVLPFANLSPDRENDYFSEGMTEELIHALARVPQLRVASRTSAFNVSRKDLDIRRIGEALAVGTVLEGSVRRAGNRLRISAQLVDTRSGYHLWSEMYDREMQDVFAVQNEISRAITAKLRVSLTSSDPTLVKPATRSLEAYHSYLRGRYFWNRPSQEALLKGIEQFERAIEADPEYAAAHSGLADCHHVLAVYGVIPPLEEYPRAKRAALRALELDERRAEGHVSLGCAAMCYDWDWEGAVREFERAIELDPTYGYAHYQYAWCLTAMGRRAEAVASVRRAAELEPLSLHIQAYAADILSMCSQCEAAIEQAQNTLELDPSFGPAIEALSHAYAYVGRYSDALATMRRIPSSPRVSQALRLAPLYARLGEVEAARRTLEEEEARLASAVVPPGNSGFYLALLLVTLGELDRGLRWLEAIVEERQFMGCLLKVDPNWREIRAHPRFIALLRTLGLE
jgi:serine/threonine protein kinase/Tfp pilus assembly protein PilF